MKMKKVEIRELDFILMWSQRKGQYMITPKFMWGEGLFVEKI